MNSLKEETRCWIVASYGLISISDSYGAHSLYTVGVAVHQWIRRIYEQS